MSHKLHPFSEKTVWKIILFLFAIITICAVVIPLLYLLALSLVSGQELAQTEVFLWPKTIEWSAYKVVLGGGSGIWQSYMVSVFRVVAGTFLSTMVTFLLGYGLSCPDLPGRKILTVAIVIVAFFNGGIIPNYMVVRNLGLLNNIWVYIFPKLITPWCVIMMTQYLKNVPRTVLEAATLDGANTSRLLLGFVLPLSLPGILTVGIFYAIDQWNTWFDAYIYVRNGSLQPIQMYLRNILASGTNINRMINAAGLPTHLRPASRSVQAAAVFACSIPIAVLYPVLIHFYRKAE